MARALVLPTESFRATVFLIVYAAKVVASSIADVLKKLFNPRSVDSAPDSTTERLVGVSDVVSHLVPFLASSLDPALVFEVAMTLLSLADIPGGKLEWASACVVAILTLWDRQDFLSRRESLVRAVVTNLHLLDLHMTVNNAGVSGITADVEGLKALQIEPESWLYGKATKLVHGVLRQSPEKAQECFETNYYGVRRVTEALVPLLEKSNSGAKIVNVSSLIGELKRIPNEQIREEFGNLEGLTEEKLGTLLQRFINDLKDGSLEANGWPMMLPAYGISKTALNAYTRILARKFPSMCINCVHPGFVKTDLNWNTGVASVEEGAKAPIMVTLLPPGGPSGKYFNQMEIGTF